MEKLLNLYKDLDPINLIIFWGIVIIIILIIILIVLMILKKKKVNKTKISINQNKIEEEELPIKKEEIIIPKDIEEKTDIFSNEEDNIFEQSVEESHEIENVVVEEPQIKDEIIELEKDSILAEPQNKYVTKEIEIPTKPYQRNVLREMSLSQTSPIGINRKEIREEAQKELKEDLKKSLNYEQEPIYKEQPEKVVKEELQVISNESPRQTEITIEQEIDDPIEELPIDIIREEMTLPQELLEIEQEEKPKDKYLEEVSKKLSETDYSNEIERTDYEIEQEENAIISYQELMEKKDSIKTIDEEDAIISIEELMNRENTKNKEANQDNKLYNINESEENDQFIKELKQFRQDL